MCALALFSGCGYRFVAPNSQLPQGIREVRAPMFANLTAEPSVELSFTQALRDQLQRAGIHTSLDAPATLQGTVNAVSSGPFMTAPTLPRQPAIRLNVSISLKLEKDGVPVSAATVSVSEEFPSGADVLLTESNRQAALRRLSEVAVREALERLQSTATGL